MFFHFSIIMKATKQRKKKFDQKSYDFLFHDIENNLRELGFGDVSVNKKMKDLNKILYDILLKLNFDDKKEFKIRKKLVLKYFKVFNDNNNEKYVEFERYFNKFYNYCFELPLDNMVRDAINFRN
jgi:cytochrome b pre-mRNA-processing protein 3